MIFLMLLFVDPLKNRSCSCLLLARALFELQEINSLIFHLAIEAIKITLGSVPPCSLHTYSIIQAVRLERRVNLFIF